MLKLIAPVVGHHVITRTDRSCGLTEDCTGQRNYTGRGINACVA